MRLPPRQPVLSAAPGGADLTDLMDGVSLAGLGDGELLARFAARADEAAFEGLVRRHGAMVLGVCRRMLGAGVGSFGADDAFQATWLVLVRRAGSVGRGDLIGPWLHAVAVRVCRQARARGRRRLGRERAGPLGELALLTVADGPTPDPLDRAETQALIDEAIARLPERDRRLIVLADVEGLSRPEVADRLGWTDNMVRGRLARARTRLRADLARRGCAPVGAEGLAPWSGSIPLLAAPSAPLVAATTRLGALMLTPLGRRLAATLAVGPALSLADGACRMLALFSWPIVGAGLVVAGTLAAGTTAAVLAPQVPAPGPAQVPAPAPVAARGDNAPAGPMGQISVPATAQASPPGEAPPPLPPPDAPLSALLAERLKSAQHRYEAQRAFYEEGRVTIDRLIEAARQVMDAEQPLAETAAQRRASVQTFVDRIQRAYEREVQELPAGRSTMADIAEAKDRLLEARILLAQVGQAEAPAPTRVDPSAPPAGPIADPPRQAATPLPPDGAQLRELLEAKLRTARHRYEAQSAFYEEGRVTIDRLIDAAHQEMQAQLALADGPDRRREVVRTQVDRLARLLTREQRELEVGRSTAAEVAEVEDALIDARVQLAREGQAAPVALAPSPTPKGKAEAEESASPLPTPRPGGPWADSPKLAELQQARITAARLILDEANRHYKNGELRLLDYQKATREWQAIESSGATTPEARTAAIQAQIEGARDGLRLVEALEKRGYVPKTDIARMKIALLDAQIRVKTGQSPPDTAATTDLDRRLSDLEKKVDRLLDFFNNRPAPRR